MDFPDRNLIAHVRDALWRRTGGGASVMVGAGFGRNADSALPGAPKMPTWAELAEKMSKALYPADRDPRRPAGAGDALRLAQEYETAFGRADLHRLLIDAVRDDEFQPGPLHTRLLRLPWRDVFTTNWDTLLERARVSAPQRAYGVVRTMDEIPLAARPRIVKLHGSLPSGFPLVFTEEDYRKYPRDSAPFVNTVQQAMMETVFLLIGFSGDDPNFLEWSGWVRDNLGASAPKIYLAGYLSLSPSRRRMLEDRNIVPIDLARHPGARGWPERLRHGHATEWLLHTLEFGEPYDIVDWPPRSKRAETAVAAYLEPVQRAVYVEPKAEPHAPSHEEKSPEEKAAELRNTIDVWQHNRRVYPGWLAPPVAVARTLTRSTEDWELRFLEISDRFPLVERLDIVRELVWRFETALAPIFDDFASEARTVLGEIDCRARTISGQPEPDADWAGIRESWVAVALALLTEARLDCDSEAFEARLSALEPFRGDSCDIRHRIHHEHCLWAAFDLDYEGLDALLTEWNVENSDPAWAMRKTALLFEIGRREEAQRLNEWSLDAIRGQPDRDDDLARPSREGWALWSSLRDEDFGRAPGPSARWKELTPLNCNAQLELSNYTDAISNRDKNRKEAPSFDLGVVSSGRRIFGGRPLEYNEWLAARRAIRLTEIAGLPPTTPGTPGWNVAANLLKTAAEGLSAWPTAGDSELAARIVLRVVNYDGDKTLQAVLSRFRVAAMEEEAAKRLASVCVRAVEYIMSEQVGADARRREWFRIEKMRVFLEGLSRFVLRLEPDRAGEVFDKALEWYRNDKIFGSVLLTKVLDHLITRAWEALSESDRVSRSLDIISSPIIGQGEFTGFDGREAHYPEPGRLLAEASHWPLRTEENKGHWRDAIDSLARALRKGGEARKRASLRLLGLSRQDILAETEKSEIAQALWGETHAGIGMPDGTTFVTDGVFLLLPEPEPGLAERRFREKWLDADGSADTEAPSSDDVLWHVGWAIRILAGHGKALRLSEQERSFLEISIERWAEEEVPMSDLASITRLDDFLYEPIRRAMEGLWHLLLAIRISEPVARKLYAKIGRLDRKDFPAWRLAPGFAMALPDRFDEIVLSLRMGLASDDSRSARGAAEDLWFWLQAATVLEDGPPPPPDDLVREIGIAIATRRKAMLPVALQVAKWIFAEGAPQHRDILRDFALQGLGYMAEELRYDRDAEPDRDAPLLRWGCTHLALAMTAAGHGGDPAVARWVENARTDPLPEVRHAEPPARARGTGPATAARA